MITPRRLSRKQISQEQGLTATWAEPDIHNWDLNDQQRYERFKRAIVDYLSGGRVENIESQYKLAISQVQEQLWRAMQIDSQGQRIGFCALIPNLQIGPVTRRKPLPDCTSPDGPTCKGGVLHILQKEDLLGWLTDRVLKRGPGPHPMRLLRSALHQELLQILKKRGYTERQYPFNTKEKMYTSLCRHIRSIQENNMHENALANENVTAAGNIGVRNGKLKAPSRPGLMEEVQADEHKLHGIGCIRIMVDGVSKLIPVERPVGIAIADVNSGAILGASLCFSPEAKESALIEAIRSAVVPGYAVKLMNGELAPKFRVCDFVPELEGVVWDVMQLDNAKIHTSDRYQDCAARLGSQTCWGPAYSWSGRPDIESKFSHAVRSFFSQIPSTTGIVALGTANPPADQAIKWDIELIDLQRLWYQSLAQITERSSNSGLLYQRPIDFIRTQISGSSQILLRKLPPPMAASPEIGAQAIRVRVVQRSKTNLNLYINFRQAAYTNFQLAQRRDLLGEYIIIHAADNIRTVLAFELSGRPLGELTADGHWGATDHTVEIRRAVMKDKTLRGGTIGDEKSPVQQLLEKKSKKLVEAGQKRLPGGIVKGGLEVARFMVASSSTSVSVQSAPPPAMTVAVDTASAAARGLSKQSNTPHTKNPAPTPSDISPTSTVAKAAQAARDLTNALVKARARNGKR